MSFSNRIPFQTSHLIFLMVPWVITFTLLSTGTTLAANSWSSSPSWSSGSSDSGQTSTARRPSYKSSSQNISPFAPESNNLSIDVGQVFLMGDLSRDYSNSIGSQLHYTYGVSDIFGFDSSFGYSDHSDGQFSMTTLLAGLRINLSWYDKVTPYLVFGMGFYRPSYRLSPKESLSPVMFGVHVGPGVNLEITKQIFFTASLTFHDAFGTTVTSSNGTYRDVGGTFTSFLIGAGVTF